MKISKTSGGEYLISASQHELVAISNCLNEVCHGIELFEFDTRVGAGKDAVLDMLSLMSDALGDRRHL